jgi:hypothetical protein
MVIYRFTFYAHPLESESDGSLDPSSPACSRLHVLHPPVRLPGVHPALLWIPNALTHSLTCTLPALAGHPPSRNRVRMAIEVDPCKSLLLHQSIPHTRNYGLSHALRFLGGNDRRVSQGTLPPGIHSGGSHCLSSLVVYHLY